LRLVTRKEVLADISRGAKTQNTLLYY